MHSNLRLNGDAAGCCNDNFQSSFTVTATLILIFSTGALVVNRSLDCRCYATRGHLAMYAANAAEFAWRDRLWRLQTCQPQAELHVLTTY